MSNTVSTVQPLSEVLASALLTEKLAGAFRDSIRKHTNDYVDKKREVSNAKLKATAQATEDAASAEAEAEEEELKLPVLQQSSQELLDEKSRQILTYTRNGTPSLEGLHANVSNMVNNYRSKQDASDTTAHIKNDPGAGTKATAQKVASIPTMARTAAKAPGFWRRLHIAGSNVNTPAVVAAQNALRQQIGPKAYRRAELLTNPWALSAYNTAGWAGIDTALAEPGTRLSWETQAAPEKIVKHLLTFLGSRLLLAPGVKGTPGRLSAKGTLLRGKGDRATTGLLNPSGKIDAADMQNTIKSILAISAEPMLARYATELYAGSQIQNRISRENLRSILNPSSTETSTPAPSINVTVPPAERDTETNLAPYLLGGAGIIGGAGILAALLNRRKAQEVLQAQSAPDGGDITVHLPPPAPGLNATTVTLPISEVNLSQTLKGQIGRDVRRRLRQGTDHRTVRRGPRDDNTEEEVEDNMVLFPKVAAHPLLKLATKKEDPPPPATFQQVRDSGIATPTAKAEAYRREIKSPRLRSAAGLMGVLERYGPFFGVNLGKASDRWQQRTPGSNVRDIGNAQFAQHKGNKAVKRWFQPSRISFQPEQMLHPYYS